MVKAFIKGGVWKNSEDEILKAAVMKYGKQQWARVASLLNRKSAKQCKARWHEWLDPSVRKVEWSRAEEEKLLHLAKLMPAQWKTIGPLVGRTATQCQEQYEKLLDEAAGGSEARGANASLQVGQIDAHPETKPARPDPIDMDEDEMEMLQEARARLANTQGKKAKRKARERLLNQAKRLADLQKRRELKQAGLLSGAARKKASKRNRDIDLGVEIPFHKPAPAGFHDTSNEAEKTERIRQKRLKQVDFHKVNENQYRTRDREAAMAQKREEARLKSLEKSNMQYVVAQVSKQNDPINTSRKRGMLELPSPQVSDQELQQLSKLQQEQASTAALAAAAGTGHAATQALLGDYTDRPLPTPMRTPTASLQQNQHTDLMRQASQLRQLEQGQTPLLSAFKTTGEEDEDDDAAAQHDIAKATPNLPPSTNRQASQTPLRDELGLNPDDVSVVSGFTNTTSIRDLARQERRVAKRARQDLEVALSALPAPQFEYELASPEEQQDAEMQDAGAFEPDMADVNAANQQQRQEEAERLYQARNTVLKRNDLPRPAGAIPELADDVDTDGMAQALIQAEMLSLLKHDAHTYPVVAAEPSKKKSKKRKKEDSTEEVALDIVPEDALDQAKEMLQLETELLMKEKIRQTMEENSEFTSEHDVLNAMARAVGEVSREGAAKLFYDEEKGCFVEGGDELEALKTEFETIREAAMVLRRKNDKISTKLGVKNGGYAKRTKTLQDDILQKFALTQNHKIEVSVFSSLADMENRGATQRTEALQEELTALEAQEAKMQKQYGDLLLEKKRLMASLKTTDA
jgi:pre-mRNA-splicing factor CDC5/CEF1